MFGNKKKPKGPSRMHAQTRARVYEDASVQVGGNKMNYNDARWIRILPTRVHASWMTDQWECALTRCIRFFSVAGDTYRASRTAIRDALCPMRD